MFEVKVNPKIPLPLRNDNSKIDKYVHMKLINIIMQLSFSLVDEMR